MSSQATACAQAPSVFETPLSVCDIPACKLYKALREFRIVLQQLLRNCNTYGCALEDMMDEIRLHRWDYVQNCRYEDFYISMLLAGVDVDTLQCIMRYYLFWGQWELRSPHFWGANLDGEDATALANLVRRCCIGNNYLVQSCWDQLLRALDLEMVDRNMDLVGFRIHESFSDRLDSVQPMSVLNCREMITELISVIEMQMPEIRQIYELVHVC